MTRDQVIQEAGKIAQANGWPFLGPVAAGRNGTFPRMQARWTVTFNNGMVGRHLRIVLSRCDRQCFREGIPPSVENATSHKNAAGWRAGGRGGSGAEGFKFVFKFRFK
jgi:hypothetical protein